MINVPYFAASFALEALVANARDAIGHSGHITIQANKLADKVTCLVTDSGKGIPSVVQPKLFQLFVSTKQRSGFGLWAANRYLAANNSYIRLIQSYPGNATFEIGFPIS